MHTIIPALPCATAAADMSLGVMGALPADGHVQSSVPNLVDYGMDVQAAIDAPRVLEGELTWSNAACRQHLVDGLKTRGHQVLGAPSPWGVKA